MSVENNHSSNGRDDAGEQFEVRLTNPMLYDRLHTLSMEYSVSVDFLVNVAVKRLVDDVDFVRKLRVGKAEEA